MDNIDKSRIQEIVRKYQAESQMELQLKEFRLLDRKVERAFLIPALSLGILGFLVLGVGISLILVFQSRVLGILVGILGLVIAALAYPIGKRSKRRFAQKLTPRIQSLGETLLNG